MPELIEVEIPSDEPPQFSPREGRPYIHDACGQVTVISGRHFPHLCNPFRFVMGTICASCGMPDSTKSFRWIDTGETVSSYRRRRVGKHPIALLFTWIILPAIGGAIAASVMLGMRPRNNPDLPDPTVAGAIFFVIGGLLTALFIAPPIVELFSGRKLYNEW